MMSNSLAPSVAKPITAPHLDLIAAWSVKSLASLVDSPPPGSATMSAPKYDHHPVIQEFHLWFRNSCCIGTLGPASEPNTSFMPSTVLESYFKDTRRLKKILEALFETRDPPVFPEAIQGNYDKVLGILLCIGKGEFIRTFVEYPTLCDEKLPFDDRPRNFPTEGSDEHFFDSFYRKQWMFCPPVFQRGKNVRHDSNCILPIVSKKELSGGASAIVYKIALHESYNRLRDAGDSEQVCSPTLLPDVETTR
jgi:hypothetical protein